QRVAPEAREDVLQLAQEGQRRDAADDAERQARERCGAREQDEAAPAMQALHEWLNLAAGDPDALEPRERRLDGLRHALAPVPGERLAQARLRLERQARGARWGRDWMKPRALPTSRTSKLSSSRRTSSSSFAGAGRSLTATPRPTPSPRGPSASPRRPGGSNA